MAGLRDDIASPTVAGRIRLCRVFDGGDVQQLLTKHNQLQYAWGVAAAQCLGKGNRDYRISAMYLEYENVASPEDPVTPPVYGRGDGLDYYQNLAFDSARDFLRIPLLTEPSLGVEAGYEDHFGEGEGNRLTFYAQSQGIAGFHGKPFSDGANSKVFGVALVATPVFNDPARDVVTNRTYFDPPDQALKMAASQFGLAWDLSFT